MVLINGRRECRFVYSVNKSTFVRTYINVPVDTEAELHFFRNLHFSLQYALLEPSQCRALRSECRQSWGMDSCSA